MGTYFEAKVKFIAPDNNTGRIKRMTETYLVDALTYTEAESRTIENFKQDGIDWEIDSIKKSNIEEVLSTPGDKWYKVKIAITDVDVAGREKKAPRYMLLSATEMDEALKSLQKELESYVVPVEIVSIADSNIVDVYNHD